MKNSIPTFDPNGEFKAKRPFTLAGVNLNYDDPVDKSAIEPRRLKQMFEARMIIADDRSPAERKAATTPKAPAKPAGAKKPEKGATPSPAAGSAPAGTQASGEPKAKIENRGFGKGFDIVDQAGTVLKAGIKSKAAAETELAKHL